MFDIRFNNILKMTLKMNHTLPAMLGISENRFFKKAVKTKKF